MINEYDDDGGGSHGGGVIMAIITISILCLGVTLHCANCSLQEIWSDGFQDFSRFDKGEKEPLQEYGTKPNRQHDINLDDIIYHPCLEIMMHVPTPTIKFAFI